MTVRILIALVVTWSVACGGQTTLPNLYLDCGTRDPWLGVNREFAQLLASRGIAHEFHEPFGDHNFNYWDRQIEVVLSLAATRLK